MGGGLMQLVAYGAQDIYLTGNPQITFFKVVYRRHTNFSMEAIQQTFSGTADFGADVTATISRNGDLVYRMYLEHDADIKSADGSDDVGVGCDYGSHLMKECELEIGGQRIDKHYGHWHSVYSQLTEFNPSGSNTTLFNRMCGNGIGGNAGLNASVNGWTFDNSAHTAAGKFWIPLYFWFCRNPGLALPLIALQYHEVKVKITFETIARLAIAHDDDAEADFAGGIQVAATAGTGNTFNLWADYIYLDTDERRRFAQVSHEYLIEQLQYENKTGGTMDLNFNHPVKELIWTGVDDRSDPDAGVATDGSDVYQRAKLSNAVTDTFQLKLNGHDRFKERDSRYFTRTQVWQHHTGYGDTQLAIQANTVTDTIAVYSFALKPEEHQPSGTCNFSRIDNAQLVQTGTATAVNVYAVNYNVLRIMSGMGGLAYSN
jgi:hypothetical protein